MDNIILIFLGVVFAGILVGIVVYCTYQIYSDKKRLENIKTNLHLVENQNYEILLNNANKLHDVKFKYISYGNNSENGKINLYFDKLTKYRGEKCIIKKQWLSFMLFGKSQTLHKILQLI